MKTTRILILVVSISLVLSVGLMPQPVSAAVEWSNDFSDNTMGDWTTLNGTWDASMGYLEATGDFPDQVENIATRDNDLYEGIFTFDLYKNSTVTGYYWIVPICQIQEHSIRTLRE